MPAGASGAVSITVFGESAQKALLASGATSVQLSGNRGKGTVTLTATSGSVDLLGFTSAGDLSGGQGSTDMAGCAQVTTCVGGDSCCPSGCNNSSDSDCASVCGNGVVEAGEVCDDSNTVSGDGCDATCTWTEKLSLLAGSAGGVGHADDKGYLFTRLQEVGGTAYDPVNQVVYFSDSTDCTIRVASGTLATPAVSTLAGSAYDCRVVQGAAGAARFNHPGDMEVMNGVLYVVDDYGRGLRAIDLTSKSVTAVTIPSTNDLISGIGQFQGMLIFAAQEGAGLEVLYGVTPSTGGVRNIYNAFPSTLVANPAYCEDVACDAASCYVACRSSIIKVPMPSGSPVTLLAGDYSGGSFLFGCATGTASALTAQVLSGATRIVFDDNDNLFYTDQFCDNVVKIDTVAKTITSVAGNGMGSGYVDQTPGAQAQFAFDGPSPLAFGAGTFYIGDNDNHVLRTMANNANYQVTTVAGVRHNDNETTFSATPSAPSVFSRTLTGLTSDGSYVYTLDSGGRILKVALANGATTLLVADNGQTADPGMSYLDLARIGSTLYIADSNDLILAIGTDGTNSVVYAGTGGQAGPSDGSLLSAQLQPLKLATDGTNLFFIDGGKEVRMIAGGMVKTLAGDSTSTGVADGTGTAAHFGAASAIATDGTYVYVADSAMASVGGVPPPASAIRRIAISGGKVDTIAGDPGALGHMDGTTALFAGIQSLVSDGKSLFIGDVGANNAVAAPVSPTIRQLTLANMTVGTSIGTVGQQTFEPGIGTAARVHQPAPLVFDPTTHALLFFDEAEYVFGRIK